jgi:hypothetical protein
MKELLDFSALGVFGIKFFRLLMIVFFFGATENGYE